MADDTPWGYSMDPAAARGVQQSLLDVSSGITATVNATSDGCTAPYSPYGNWSTTQSVYKVHSAHTKVHTASAAACATHSDNLGISIDNVVTTEASNTSIIAGVTGVGTSA